MHWHRVRAGGPGGVTRLDERVHKRGRGEVQAGFQCSAPGRLQRVGQASPLRQRGRREKAEAGDQAAQHGGKVPRAGRRCNGGKPRVPER